MASLSRVLVGGSSGLIGSALTQVLAAKEVSVSRLVRKSTPPGPQEIIWIPRPANPVYDMAALEGFDAVVYLGGANLASHRWTKAYKQEIVASRVPGTHAIAQLLAQCKRPPAVLLCASAVGIYGDRGDEILTEESPRGDDFLAGVCRAWEGASKPAWDAGIRVVNLRFGVVLSPQGGMLKKVLLPFRLGFGGRLGTGQQWMSWISLSDAVQAILYLIQNDGLSGPVNIVSPIPVTNAEFTQTLAEVLHRPAVFPVPPFALRLAFGEMADSMLASTRAIPAYLAKSGFHFEHAQLAQALAALLRKA